MTRKDFILIAGVVRSLAVTEPIKNYIAHEFADALRHTNPNFDRGRFLDAALREERIQGR